MTPASRNNPIKECCVQVDATTFGMDIESEVEFSGSRSSFDRFFKPGSLDLDLAKASTETETVVQSKEMF